MHKPFLIERIISALTYITVGFAGFVWIIVGVIVRKPLTKFLQFHIFQSIFLSILYFLLATLIRFADGLLVHIPFINILWRNIIAFFNVPIFGMYSLIQAVVYGVILYLTVFSFMGLYARIPWVSDIIDQNVGR